MSNQAIAFKKYLRTAAIGFGMGSADLVPGVSGGTIAFISGIYAELVNSIKTLSGETVKHVLRGQLVLAWRSVPFGFLAPLGLGMMGAILMLSSVLTYLLTDYPVYIWSFFFGLVLASIALVSKRIPHWTMQLGAVAGLATLITYVVVGLMPMETPATPIAFFLAGFVAICAMILPGISGSFLLLILGKYEQVLAAVTNRDVVTLAIFSLGAVIGLALFSRVLSWLFSKHHDLVVAALTGLMIGSLRKLWPWREVTVSRVNSHGVEEAVVTANILPPVWDYTVLIALGLAIAGVVLIVVLDRFSPETDLVNISQQSRHTTKKKTKKE